MFLHKKWVKNGKFWGLWPPNFQRGGGWSNFRFLLHFINKFFRPGGSTPPAPLNRCMTHMTLYFQTRIHTTGISNQESPQDPPSKPHKDETETLRFQLYGDRRPEDPPTLFPLQVHQAPRRQRRVHQPTFRPRPVVHPVQRLRDHDELQRRPGMGCTKLTWFFLNLKLTLKLNLTVPQLKFHTST